MLACDRDFGNLATYIRGQKVYTTPHYVALMTECRSANPITVVEMTSSDFFDLQPLQSVVTKTHLAKSKYKEGHMFLYEETYKQGMKIWQTYGHDLNTPTPFKLQKGKGVAYDPANSPSTLME
ncbi:hypothetical protein E2C01_029847 [Portunus trituberculatus]|uniref:Uncharacterized protein n=1 Tax=Portunus trituberculatus TaxID=210409 RepID=A0A5B7ENY9_PORTR|nr:hypothetical protein [Portunus trituberculatus]